MSGTATTASCVAKVADVGVSGAETAAEIAAETAAGVAAAPAGVAGGDFASSVRDVARDLAGVDGASASRSAAENDDEAAVGVPAKLRDADDVTEDVAEEGSIWRLWERSRRARSVEADTSSSEKTESDSKGNDSSMPRSSSASRGFSCWLLRQKLTRRLKAWSRFRNAAK